MRILYVEDEKVLADAVTFLLKKADIETDWVSDGEEGLELALKPVYDVIVLDIMLPSLSGLEILTALRKKGINTPVIMLSALGEAEDKIRALENGADDYLAKPFKTSELIARLKALVRRPPIAKEGNIQFEDLTVDCANRTLNGIDLTEKEFEILKMLIKNPNTAQTKENILAHVWGADAYTEDNYVEVYISYIRKKLRQLNSRVSIKTIRNLGYKLIVK